MQTSLLDQPAPDFARTDQNGQPVSLAVYRGKQVVVLYFYPRDGTPVCTREACAFRDAFEEFVQAGAVVIGVSASPTVCWNADGEIAPAAGQPATKVPSGYFRQAISTSLMTLTPSCRTCGNRERTRCCAALGS